MIPAQTFIVLLLSIYFSGSFIFVFLSFRRLIFLQNQNIVQTEARLVYRKAKGGGGSKSSGKVKNKSASVKKTDSKSAVDDSAEQPIDEFEFDLSYLDDHHRGFLASLSLAPSVLLERLKAGAIHALVVGFAGAALSMCLQRYLPLARITFVDLDGMAQERIARYFFMQIIAIYI